LQKYAKNHIRAKSFLSAERREEKIGEERGKKEREEK